MQTAEPRGDGLQFILATGELLDVLFAVLLFLFHEPLFDPGGFVARSNVGEIRWLFAFRWLAVAGDPLRFDRMAFIALVLFEQRFTAGAKGLGAGKESDDERQDEWECEFLHGRIELLRFMS